MVLFICYQDFLTQYVYLVRLLYDFQVTPLGWWQRPKGFAILCSKSNLSVKTLRLSIIHCKMWVGMALFFLLPTLTHAPMALMGISETLYLDSYYIFLHLSPLPLFLKVAFTKLWLLKRHYYIEKFSTDLVFVILRCQNIFFLLNPIWLTNQVG